MFSPTGRTAPKHGHGKKKDVTSVPGAEGGATRHGRTKDDGARSPGTPSGQMESALVARPKVQLAGSAHWQVRSAWHTPPVPQSAFTRHSTQEGLGGRRTALPVLPVGQIAS